MISDGELEAHCIAAAEAGARVLRDKLDQPRAVSFKGRIDLVTDADRAAEEVVLQVLAERAPGVAVLAEESGAHGQGEGSLRFVVDPLDGTTNYAHGVPLFACTVAAESGGHSLAGCTVDVARAVRYRAARGRGAYSGPAFLEASSRERRLRVSDASALEGALICTGFAVDARSRRRLPQMLRAWERFTELSQGTRRLGSAALDLALVAAGNLDAFYEHGLKIWDVAAGVVLVEEAGGVLTRFDGAPHELAGGEILAAPEGLHPALLEVLKGVL